MKNMHIRQDEWTQNEANMVYLWYIIYTHTHTNMYWSFDNGFQRIILLKGKIHHLNIKNSKLLVNISIVEMNGRYSSPLINSKVYLLG